MSKDVVKMRGLPAQKRMRHDQHFVDSLTRGALVSVGKMIAISQIHPLREQARREMGDLSDLVASIKEKGVLEPILVRRHGNHFQIIAGERRFRACQTAGLTQVPCIEIDVDERGTLEISLIENLQRKDLTPVEEAFGIKQLADKFLYTHDQISRQLGKSRSAVTEILSITNIPEEVLEYCREYLIASRSHLVAIARQPDLQSMLQLAEQIRTQNLTRSEIRELKKQAQDEPEKKSSPKPFVFRYRSQDKRFAFSLRFAKTQVTRREIIDTLRLLLKDLESQKG